MTGPLGVRRSPFDASLHADPVVHLLRGSGRPLQRQLVEQLRAAIIDGRLPSGSRLPSTRSLARESSASRNLVVAAYEDLYAEGFVEGVSGSGTFVRRDLEGLRWVVPASNVAEVSGDRSAGSTPALPGHLLEFRIDQGRVEALSIKVWKQIWRRELADTPPPNHYLPEEGAPDLRAAVAAYLARARGVRCDPADIIITSGSQHAIELVARASIRQGDLAAIEDPGYPQARGALRQAGARLLPIPVDEDGICVEVLNSSTSSPVVVYVTPSHQFPLGVRLSVARRLALLEWAEAHGSLIIEDDYDSEFRYGAAPLPALAALGGSNSVAYVGTFSKILTPAFRLGYLVAPGEVRERIARIRRFSDWHSSWPLQRALARFIEIGEFDRHVRRMRRLYSKKRATLAGVLETVPDIGSLQGVEAGLHVLWKLRTGLDSREIARRALDLGVQVSLLDDFWLAPTVSNGLLLGYGALEVEEVRRGAHRLVEAARAVRPIRD